MATTTTTTPAIVADVAVNKLLDNACAHAASADENARTAAKKAYEMAGKAHGLSRGQLVNALVAAYSAHLLHKNVRDSFSAALAILAANVPVTVIATEIGEKAGGKLTAKAPEIAEAGTKPGDGKVAKTLTPEDQIGKLSADMMKKAAASARETLGIAKKGENKGGRPAVVTVTQGARAPFAEEVQALVASPEGRDIFAKALRPVLEHADGFANFARMLHALGYTVSAIPAAQEPKAPKAPKK